MGRRSNGVQNEYHCLIVLLKEDPPDAGIGYVLVEVSMDQEAYRTHLPQSNSLLALDLRLESLPLPPTWRFRFAHRCHYPAVPHVDRICVPHHLYRRRWPEVAPLSPFHREPISEFTERRFGKNAPDLMFFLLGWRFWRARRGVGCGSV